MDMQSFKQFVGEPQVFNEYSLARVHQHTQNRNIGMMTAHRGEFTADENRERNRQLEDDIRKHGFGFTHVKGRYIENHGTPQARPVDEHSYLIHGKAGNDNGELKHFLMHHGEKYGQDSVLHKAHDAEHAHLIGTREGGFPGKGVSHQVGKWHPNRAGEFHSVMRGRHGAGRTFAFESIQFLVPKSFSVREEVEF
jgi:hypothetical protein